MMATTNITGNGTQTKTFDGLVSVDVFQSISFSAVNILLSITATLGNSLILVALHKESSLYPPSKLLYGCLATTDFLVGLVTQPLYATYWISVVYEHWSLFWYARDAVFISSHALCSVSLSTLTAISVDRLLALLLGLRYKKIVTLRRTYIILAIVWALSLVAGICSYLNYSIAIRCSFVGISSCLVILVASYTEIFRALSHHQASQPNALNMVRYRKALHSAVWVQLGLIVCYVPYFTLIILCEVRCPNDIRIEGIAIVLVFFNSTLNPFLYCWKITEVRQAVKQTIRQAISCA